MMRTGIGTITLLAVLAVAPMAAARTLTVDESVALALDHSLTVDAAEYGQMKCKAEATEALLAFFPKLNATMSYTRLEPVPFIEFDTGDFLGGDTGGSSCDDITEDDVEPPFTLEMMISLCEMITGWMTPEDTGEPQRIEMGRADNWAAGGSLEQIVFAGGALHQSRAASMDLYRASEEQVRLARQQTAFDAEQMFYQLVAARNAVRVTDDAVALTEAYVQDLSNLSEVGMASRADLLAAKVQLSQAKLDSMKAGHGTHLLETMFKVQLGIPREETIELEMDEQLPVSELPSQRDEILALALRSRPDLAGMDHTLDAMKHYSNAAWASWLPAVVLIGNLNAQNPNYSNEQEWMFTANATVALSWSIWDRGAAIQKNRAAKAGYYQLRSHRQLLAEMMDVELESAITSFDEAEAELEVAGEGLALASESVRLERERFDAGVSNNTQLLTAQTALAGSELAVLQAETQMRISYAALRKAVGFDPEVK